MGIRDLACKYAKKHGMSRAKAQRVIESVFDVVEESIIESGKLQIIDRFTLEKVDRAETNGTHPRTHVPIKIPSKSVLRIRAGKRFSKRLNSK